MRKLNNIALTLVVLSLAAVTTLTFLSDASAQATSDSDILNEFPVSGSPLHITAETAGRIWFTMPSRNAIGALVVTSTSDYHMDEYPVPTSNSEPYDLEFADGHVWFTERTGNKIGRLDTTSGTIAEFDVPTASSRPAGIDVLPGAPATVWFAERNAGKLGRLTVTATHEYTMTEYPLTGDVANGHPQDVSIQAADKIWFTVPAVAHIGRLHPAGSTFATTTTGDGSEPWSIVVRGGFPWLTDRANARIGQFFPQTLSTFRWFSLPTNSDPYGITSAAQYIWFTERGTNRVGQLNVQSDALREFALPAGSAPSDVSVDGTGCAWIAESNDTKIARWCAPYFHFSHLPLVIRE